MSDPHTQPTIFTEEENATLSIFSAEYSAGLNGAGPVNRFHHAKGRDLIWTKAGLRDFFRYADPGIRQATGNRLDVHLVHANEAPEYGTGWHRHKLGFHAIYMVSGWARFMYVGKPTLVETSDFVQHAAGHHPLPLRLQPGHVLPRDRHGRHAGRYDPGRGCRAILRDPGANAVGEGLILQHRTLALPFSRQMGTGFQLHDPWGPPPAAAFLNASQPAFTRTIKRIEDVLEVSLFERTARRVQLPAAGREFVAVADRVLNDLRISVRNMRDLADQQRGQVIVASILSQVGIDASKGIINGIMASLA
jgi:hypothetical protein